MDEPLLCGGPDRPWMAVLSGMVLQKMKEYEDRIMRYRQPMTRRECCALREEIHAFFREEGIQEKDLVGTPLDGPLEALENLIGWAPEG